MEFPTLPNEYNGNENKVASKMLEIMRLAFEINPPTEDNVGKKKTAVFVDWSPHCPLLDVRIFSGGWTEDADPDEKYSIYTADAEESLDKIIKRLYEIRGEERKNDRL